MYWGHEHVMQVDLGHGPRPEEACAIVAGLCLVGWHGAGAVGPVTMCPRDLPRDDATSGAQDCSLTGLPLYPPLYSLTSAPGIGDPSPGSL